jgi:hypothetical protein
MGERIEFQVQAKSTLEGARGDTSGSLTGFLPAPDRGAA